ncbi:MAG TPA: protein kinase, partial [Ignavibacteriaceae bacterium]|nr:protein kinase [Ignavibacteriaceae bacterium]
MDMVGKLITHYEIQNKIGEGGMGVVYKAQDMKLGRSVAIKFLPPHLASSVENKSRFLQEAKAAAALNHPNILSIYEIDEQDGSLFIVMEFIEGETLKSYIYNIKSGSGIPYIKASEWLIQIGQGLKAAHDKNIIHRDIKSENIMITNDGQLKIMDFGLAKLQGNSGLTKTGTSLGTLSYMSPEQAQGLPADHRSDIWSLGVVFYEMLTGETLFKAEHEAALLYLIVNEEPPAPSLLDRKIPIQIDLIVKKMLSKDLSFRYQNIDSLLTSLSEVKEEMDRTSNTQKRKAIAVLPFDNISSDKENEYFGDGLTEELIANLSRLKEMRVISRTTSMQYKDTKKDIQTIGKELGARYIMEGSVRKFHDDLRITAQLIDVDSDEQLWAETYKGKLSDIFDIQEKVAKQIVDALMVKLTPTEKVELTKRPTLNAEAYDFNLRARNYLYLQTKNNIQFAIQFFDKAISLDSRYAEAYAGLAEAYAIKYAYFDRKDEWLEKALELSLKAIMYDSTLSEAYAALALAYFYKSSIDEALTAVNKSLELDPNNFFGYWILGRIYFTTDRISEAVQPFKKVLELNPDFYTAFSDLRMIYERLGEKQKHDELVQSALDFFPKYLNKIPEDSRAHIFYAQQLLLGGKKENAKEEINVALDLSPDDNVMQYNAACMYSRMDEKNEAIDVLNRIIAAGFANFEW